MKKENSFNVLHVCDYSANYRGNFIDSLASLERHQSVKNFYLFPISANQQMPRKWIDELNENGQVAYIQEGSFLKNIFLFRRIIRKHKINRIVRHFSDFKIDVIIKFLFGGKKVIRFFHSRCNPSSSALKHKFKEFIWKHNKLVGVSNSVTNEIKQVYPKFSIHTVINAINFDRLDKVDDFQRKEEISLLMMGWSYEIKGVDLAVKATKALREKYKLALHIVGGRNERKIKELTEDILGEKVDWIYFLPPTNNVGTYYKGCDIFLSPSRQEAFGYANIEAVYCKNSIVLSKVDGQGELQIDGAYWFEPNNLEEFIQQLEFAIKEVNLEEKIVQREEAKRKVQQTYSLEEWSKKVFELF